MRFIENVACATSGVVLDVLSTDFVMANAYVPPSILIWLVCSTAILGTDYASPEYHSIFVISNACSLSNIRTSQICYTAILGS